MSPNGSPREGPLRLGAQFLKYTIRSLLGTGGHAWVYHGHDEFLDVEVAIKILHRPGGVTNDMRRRGQAEAKLLYRLKHENIVSVIDAGITGEGLLYIVMELLEGETLRRLLLKRGRLAVTDALSLFAKVADGVSAAHAFGAIHRDLKPENTFVLGGSQPKILDFGIAKVVDAAGWTTEKDVIHGTILYMSPEQLRGERATAQSDVYALGLMLFETLHGRHPLLLKNTSPTMKELTWMQLSVKPPRLDELELDVPRHVGRLVERMILKVPAHRPSSMHECAEAIRACLSRITSEEDAPNADGADTDPVVVTDRIHDTEPVDGTPFDSTTTVPPVPVQQPELRATDPIELKSQTVRPVTAAATRTAPSRVPPRFDDDQRRWLLQVLVASCIAGAALGGAVVVAHGPTRRESTASPATLSAGAVPVAEVEIPAALPAEPQTEAAATVPASPTDTASAAPLRRITNPPIIAASARRPHAVRKTKRQEPPEVTESKPFAHYGRIDTTTPILE